MKYAITIAVTLWLCCCSAIAQSPRDLEFAIRIDEMECTGSGCTLQGWLNDIGTIQGGATAGVYRNKSSGDAYVGDARYQYMSDGIVYVEWRGDTAKAPAVGDFFYIHVKTAMLTASSLLCDLTRLAIKFTTVEGEDFYDYADPEGWDHPDLEPSTIRQMVDDIHYTAENMRGEMEPVYVPSGRYKDMEILDAMAASEESDVRNFLNYVRLRPRPYMGERWKISEVYATWLVSNSPMPVESIRQELESTTNEKDFRNIVDYLSDEEITAITESLNTRAEIAAGDDQVQKAVEMAGISLRVAETAARNDRIAWAVYTMANIQRRTEEYQDALAGYRRAEALFRKEKMDVPVVFAMEGISACLNEQGGYRETISLTQKAIKSTVDWNWDVLAATRAFYILLGSLQYEQAFALHKTGKLEKSRTVYEEAISNLDLIEERSALRKKALLLLSLANLLDDMQLPDEANDARVEGKTAFDQGEEMKNM